MKHEQKQQIKERIIFLSKKESQNKIAKRAGVSTATMSQLVNDNWTLIRDEMWRKIQVNLKIEFSWNTAETTNFKALQKLLFNVKKAHLSVGISHDAGAGKTHSFDFFRNNFDNVIHIECKNYWTKKSYVKKLLSSSGLNDHGTTEELIDRFVDYAKSIESPLLIIDQADKLKDNSLDLFMDFYNDLFGHCGFILSGVPALEKRIRRGVQRDRIGYRELWSRIGRKFITLKPIKLVDVKMICEANGMMDEQAINYAYNVCEGDLRRVRREIDKYYLTKKAA